jgi:hypothetical protein
MERLNISIHMIRKVIYIHKDQDCNLHENLKKTKMYLLTKKEEE